MKTTSTQAPLAPQEGPAVTAKGQPLPMLTFEAIQAVPDLKEEGVDVPEWGGRVTITGLTLGQMQEIRRAHTVAGVMDEAAVQIGVVAAGMVSPRLTPDQAEVLKLKAAGPVIRLSTAVMRLSGMTEDATKKAEATFRA